MFGGITRAEAFVRGWVAGGVYFEVWLLMLVALKMQMYPRPRNGILVRYCLPRHIVVRQPERK